MEVAAKGGAASSYRERTGGRKPAGRRCLAESKTWAGGRRANPHRRHNPSGPRHDIRWLRGKPRTPNVSAASGSLTRNR